MTALSCKGAAAPLAPKSLNALSLPFPGVSRPRLFWVNEFSQGMKIFAWANWDEMQNKLILQLRSEIQRVSAAYTNTFHMTSYLWTFRTSLQGGSLTSTAFQMYWFKLKTEIRAYFTGTVNAIFFFFFYVISCN